MKLAEKSLTSNWLYPGIKQITHNRQMEDVPILFDLLQKG